MSRWFVYQGSDRRAVTAPSGNSYFFEAGVYDPATQTRSGGNPTEVADEDGDYFLYQGNTDTGVYAYRESDAAGVLIGPFPPILPGYGESAEVAAAMGKEAMWDVRKAPTDKGLPPAKVWRTVTEDMSDPVLYYHFIRTRRQRSL